ncbi:NAD(P)H-dependent oxidoreductase [Burkholderia sp. WAC0059]|uniref:NADPH-dependent FMN reductase n=1 Tax=Burkholderia sp. WAC0059 TaxID=2066022 RepID=UPI000C7F6255|nr:NADPH-dependent FMN reductase [Burkholderia sp. WAC0059]PLZ00468.1 NAD(P)H-dependent oxidoreductase [Burkholderia sp. WAC0059]
MTTSLKIVGIAGSLRSASYSHLVLKSIVRALPAGTRVETLDIGALPHYNEDIERQTLPEAVADARAHVLACDAVVIVTPEFNHGLPGVLKNTLDWLSRPAFASCMQGKPVFFATLSPGALGGVRAQYQLRETLASMLCRLVPLPEIAITQIGAKVANGELNDPATVDFIGQSLRQFLDAIQPAAAGR